MRKAPDSDPLSTDAADATQENAGYCCSLPARNRLSSTNEIAIGTATATMPAKTMGNGECTSLLSGGSGSVTTTAEEK